MAKIPDPFDRSFETQSVNDLIVTLNHTAQKGEAHPAFLGDVSEYVSLPPRLIQLATRLEAARDNGNAADVQDLVNQAVQALNFNADHIVRLANYRNDPSLLHNTGYDHKQKGAPKGKVNLLDLVPEIQLKHIDGVSGGIVVAAKLAKSKASLQLQVTTTPDVEESWKGLGEGTYNKARTEHRGLEPAQKIYVRGRYHENGGVGHWSTPVCLIVL